MPAGRPTEYSAEKHKKVEKYLDGCVTSGNTPYIEEISYFLGVTSETLRTWAKVHPEFLGTIKKIDEWQKLCLLKTSSTKDAFTPGQIFQLKANHGMVETEKRISELSGTMNLIYEQLSDEQLDALLKQKSREVGDTPALPGETTPASPQSTEIREIPSETT